MNIVTISREFGSGGREIGKRVAEILGYDYYDREIISAIAENKNLDEDYIEHALSTNLWQTYPLSFRHSFISPLEIGSPQTHILLEQKRVIEEIAKKGKNCVLVGRNADILLKEYHPLNIFICADMQAKIDRCRERADEDEAKLTDKEFKRRIKRIDKNRARTRSIVADGEWGDRKSYHLIVNTTGWNIKELSISIADLVTRWFSDK